MFITLYRCTNNEMMDISQYIIIWIPVVYNAILSYHTPRICLCVCVYKIMCNNILVYSSALVLATCCAILVNHKYREFDLNFHREYTPLSL